METKQEKQMGQSVNKSQKSNKIKKSYDVKREQRENEKLSFLKNPITRPAGYWDDSEKRESDEVAPQSLATASRLACLEPKDQKSTQSKFGSDLDKIAEADEYSKDKKKIHVDFENLDDNVTDQGQVKDDHSDNKSLSESKSIEPRESLSFKPNHILKAPAQSTSDVPMSFGFGVLGPNSNHDMDDEM